MGHCWAKRFHTITTSYYRGALGIMLVYDLRNYKSFVNINKWIRNINEHASENVEKILVGNKWDDFGPGERVVTYDQGRDFAAEHGLPFLETSTVTGENIEEAFYLLAGNILARIQQQPSNPSEDISIRQNPPPSTRSNCCT